VVSAADPLRSLISVFYTGIVPVTVINLVTMARPLVISRIASHYIQCETGSSIPLCTRLLVGIKLRGEVAPHYEVL
jgi:hypothetical protein